MSFFAGGVWQSATASPAQASTTTSHVSASPPISRRGTVTSLGAREPSLSDQNADPTNGRRYTFRGLARALPYFMRSTAATTVSVTAEEVERPAVSSSPSQSLTDLQPKASTKQSNVVRDEPQEAENGTTERDGSNSQEGTESLKREEPRAVPGRYVRLPRL